MKYFDQCFSIRIEIDSKTRPIQYEEDLLR